ncbi:MAG: hypothetical protein WAK31_31625 [Chthoniobacterales bacterium]
MRQSRTAIFSKTAVSFYQSAGSSRIAAVLRCYNPMRNSSVVTNPNDVAFTSQPRDNVIYTRLGKTQALRKVCVAGIATLFVCGKRIDFCQQYFLGRC